MAANGEMRVHIFSIVSILAFLAHFWVAPPGGIVLWAVAATTAISSIHRGMMARGQEQPRSKRWMTDSAVIIGVVILIAITFSAIFLLVPQVQVR